jgi:hypothetical protein
MAIGKVEESGVIAAVRPVWTPTAFVFSLIALLGIFVDHGWSQGAPMSVDTAPISFNIPSQPLASAVEAYARACGMEVLYESSIVEGRRSPLIEGEFTPEMALQMLLSDTGLRVSYARRNAITLSAPAAEDEANLPPAAAVEEADLSLDTLRVSGGNSVDASRLREFSTAIQLEIERALRQNKSTRSGNYRVNVSLWIDASRKIQRVTLARSTGDVERDASIPIALQGLVLTRAPPANAPQPVQVVISVRSL